MAILKREDFINKLKARIGDDTSDDSLQFIEDMTDTYDDLSKNKGTGDTTDWKSMYEENDKMWRQKYRDRFFAPSNTDTDPINPATEDTKSEEEIKAEQITVNDLFTAADKKE